MSVKERKQYHITCRDDRDTILRVEAWKRKLNFKSNEDVVDHYIPKSDTDFFEKEWEIFKKNILTCIINDSQTHNFLIMLEQLYFIGIVNNKKIPNYILEHIIEEHGIEKPISMLKG